MQRVGTGAPVYLAAVLAEVLELATDAPVYLAAVLAGAGAFPLSRPCFIGPKHAGTKEGMPGSAAPSDGNERWDGVTVGSSR